MGSLLRQEHPKLVFLQEIWLPHYDQNKMCKDFPEYNFHAATPDIFIHNEDKIQYSQHVWHGAAVAWHHDLNHLVSTLPVTYERFSGIAIRFSESCTVVAISLYAPTSGKDDDFHECIDHLSDFLANNVPDHCNIIIGTDSNCSTRSSRRRQQTWSKFCEAFNLQINATDAPTFHHHNGSSESCIDYFLCNIPLFNLRQICTLKCPTNMSSHDPILASLSIVSTSTKSISKHSHTYSDLKRKRIIWDDTKLHIYKSLSDRMIKDAVEYWSMPEAIPLLCNLLPNLLVKCAEMCMDHKTAGKASQGLKSSKKIKKAGKLVQAAYRRWKENGKSFSSTNPTRIAYLKSKADFQKVRRNEDSLAVTRENNFLIHSNISNRNLVYARMKKHRDKKSSSKPLSLETPVGCYSGEDVLEGFAADAEYLGRERGECQDYDNEFYRLCKLDNAYIFEFKGMDEVTIPPISRKRFDEILEKEMKKGKASDIYNLSVEHIQQCGVIAKDNICTLLNSIIANIYFLTCPQIKCGLGTAVHKRKGKPKDQSKFYRRITVSPLLGCILDRYIDPVTEQIFRVNQCSDQLGFTQGISYLLASVQRGECQRWAVDHKITCFGVSLDGESAFPNVDRDIQVRELFAVGERGDYLKYSKNTYVNTICAMQLDGKLSRNFIEYTGNRQGHIKASGHFKAYINPCLESLNEADLGFHIGPIGVVTESCADDTYLQSDSISGLQGALNIVAHYAKRYRMRFNSGKTKIVVTGSKHDMDYYKEIKPWKLNGEQIDVVDANDHLGMVVSGIDEEQKNIDQNISKCRNSLFALLGPALSFKCKLSPTVQLHIWRTYALPVLLSGLAALPIRPAQLNSLQVFQNKIIRGFLKQSRSSPVASLYFLSGELPIAAKLHYDLLILFHNVWSNPQTKIFRIVRYILTMSDSKSTTWSVHVRLVCLLYGLPDPLILLQQVPMTKSAWHTLVKTKLTAYHEQELRDRALANHKLEYFNVQTLGLSGKAHPMLNIKETRDSPKLSAHLRLLTGDIASYHNLSMDRGIEPHCRLCHAPHDHTQHILTECPSTAEVRDRLYPELVNLVASIDPSSHVLNRQETSNSVLTQFILDPASMNLPNSHRISFQHPRLHELYGLSRDWAFAILNKRAMLLKLLKHSFKQ